VTWSAQCRQALVTAATRGEAPRPTALPPAFDAFAWARWSRWHFWRFARALGCPGCHGVARCWCAAAAAEAREQLALTTWMAAEGCFERTR